MNACLFCLSFVSFIQVKIFSSVKMCGFIGQLLDTVFIAVFNNMLIGYCLVKGMVTFFTLFLVILLTS